MIILAARPSVGKTAFALDIARRTAVDHQTKVGLFSIEMNTQQLLDRMISAQSMVNAWNIRTGKLSHDHDRSDVLKAIDELHKADIFIDERPGNTISSIRTTARKMKREHDIDVIIIDYLQLIAPVETAKSDSIVQQVTEISHALKQIARELQIPVIALSQLSRNIEQRGGEPKLSDLRDSGSIEQDADIVMFLHKNKSSHEEEEDNNLINVIIAKHRNGPIGKFDLFFEKKTVSFRDLDSRAYSEDIPNE